MNLKEFRQSKGLSQEQFAIKIGVSYSMLVKVENGRAGASKNFMDKIKKVYPDISIDKVFFAQ